MKKNIFLIILIICLSNYSYGQKESELYKRIYKTADSLKSIHKTSYIDTDSLFIKLKELEKKDPYGFFDVIDGYMLKSKFNEASFVYFLGTMRYEYYNSVNPDYNNSRLLNNLFEVFGGYLIHYLRTDVDNYINIVKMSVDYYINNDFAFFSKNNNIEKFNLQIESYVKHYEDIEKNKEKYILHWKAERKVIEEEIKIYKREAGNKGQ